MAIHDVKISFRGMGAYLRTSTELRAACRAHAEHGAEFARSIAPVGPDRRTSRPPGEFKASIHVEDAEIDTKTGPRVGARIYASPAWVEFGRPHTNKYQGSHTLGRTRDVISSPRRTE